MSIFVTPAGTFDTVSKSLTTSTVTEILSATAKTTVLSIHVVEKTGGGGTIILERFDGTNAFQLTGQETIAANGRLDYNFGFSIDRGWSVRATAGIANQFDVTLSYLIPD